MSTKTFNIAGTSVDKNKLCTWRFANHETGDVRPRTYILKSGGHTEIALMALPHAMTKVEAVKYLQSLGWVASMPLSKKQVSVPEGEMLMEYTFREPDYADLVY